MRALKHSSPVSQQDLQASCSKQELCKSETAGERKISHSKSFQEHNIREIFLYAAGRSTQSAGLTM